VRCFVAVDVAASVRAALARTQRALRRAAPTADVRWTRPEGLHITLKFLGEVPEARCAEVVAALTGVAAAHRAVRVLARGLGGFPGAGRPRVLWAGLAKGDVELAALARDVDRALAPLGFAAETRPFQGHVTLGRVRSPRGLVALATALAQRTHEELGAWTVSELVLYRSRLSPAGARYEALARLPFGAADPPPAA
jgi:2'-5' RNA ligase